MRWPTPSLYAGRTSLAVTGRYWRSPTPPSTSRFAADTTPAGSARASAGRITEGAAHSGAPFELPNDTAYAETCAAIASVMWNDRMLEAKGEVRYADELERALYNAVLVGVDRTEPLYAYENPLEAGAGERRHPWFECACCPPNIMRTLASLERYLVSGDRIHQYATGTYGGVRITTDYPWDGRIEIEGEATLRVPAWCESARLNGEPVARGWVRGGGVLELDMPFRVIEDERSNAGRIAIARGPLIYCLDGTELVPYAFNSGRRPLQVWVPAQAGAA